MERLGIIAFKANSGRFPQKNQRLYKSNYDILKKTCDKVILATDLQLPEKTHHRGMNIIANNSPIFDVWKWAYQNEPEQFDCIVCVLANVTGLQESDINEACEVLVNNDLWEVRSFNDSGVENGLVVFAPEAFDRYQVSVYQGAIITEAKEIHYEHEMS